MFEVFAEFYGFFQGPHAHLAGFAVLDVGFDILTRRGVQFPVDILGKLFEKGQTIAMGMVGITPFHNKLSMRLLKKVWRGEGAL